MPLALTTTLRAFGLTPEEAIAHMAEANRWGELSALVHEPCEAPHAWRVRFTAQGFGMVATGENTARGVDVTHWVTSRPAKP